MAKLRQVVVGPAEVVVERAQPATRPRIGRRFRLLQGARAPEDLLLRRGDDAQHVGGVDGVVLCAVERGAYSRRAERAARLRLARRPSCAPGPAPAGSECGPRSPLAAAAPAPRPGWRGPAQIGAAAPGRGRSGSAGRRGRWGRPAPRAASRESGSRTGRFAVIPKRVDFIQRWCGSSGPRWARLPGKRPAQRAPTPRPGVAPNGAGPPRSR